MRRRLFVVAVAVISLICPLAACTKDKGAEEHSQRVAGLQAAYDAVAAVEKATKAGVAYEAYSKMLPSVSAALRDYEPPDIESRAVVAHLSAAVYSYQNAERAWATEYDECQECAWRKFVAAHPQFSIEDADPEYAVSVLWNTAAGEMSAAKEALDAWKAK